jgi:hypothetical protein
MTGPRELATCRAERIDPATNAERKVKRMTRTNAALEIPPDDFAAANERLAKIGLAPAVETRDEQLAADIAAAVSEAQRPALAEQLAQTPVAPREDLCSQCGVTDAEWDFVQRPGGQVEMKTLKPNQRVGYGTGKNDHTLYTHRCKMAPQPKQTRLSVKQLRERFQERANHFQSEIERGEKLIAETRMALEAWERNRDFWDQALAEIDRD